MITETQLTEAIATLEAAAEKAVARVAILQLVPPEAQLLNEHEAMALLSLGKEKFYALRLPRYLPDGQPKAFTDSAGRRIVRAGTVRYRLADIITHIETHMRTAEGNLLHERAMRRRPTKPIRTATPDPQPAAA